MALRWHPRVAMPKEKIDYFLGGRLLARLATVSKDGYPHVTPVWYYWDGNCIFINLGKLRAPTRNLRRNPRCAVVVDIDDRPLIGFWDNMAKAVLIVGDAELYESKQGAPEPRIPVEGKKMKPPELAALIAHRYPPNPSEELKVLPEMIKKASATYYPVLQGENDRVFIRIKPKKIKGWDFSKAPFKD